MLDPLSKFFIFYYLLYYFIHINPTVFGKSKFKISIIYIQVTLSSHNHNHIFFATPGMLFFFITDTDYSLNLAVLYTED